MKTKLTILTVILFSLVACDSQKQEQKQTQAPASSDKGIGPVTSITIGALDASLAEKGKSLFDTRCGACHKFGERYVGPDLTGITKRRTPEWTMNMILNPVEMTQKNEAAKQLLSEYLTQMTFQNISQDETRAIYEYFRKIDEAK